jgi:hypothetical protein
MDTSVHTAASATMSVVGAETLDEFDNTTLVDRSELSNTRHALLW